MTGQFRGDDITGQRFQSGTVKNVQSHTCQSLENIISHGIWNVRQRNVPSVALPSLLARKEPSIPGWTLVSRHYSLQKFKKDEEFFKRTYPTAVRPQAKDIVRTWLYYTLLRCENLTGKKPWSEAWIMGYGLDEKGLKMSKSKGNALDPLPIIEKFGADTFRFWSASEVNHGNDFRCSEQKIESTKKFLTKLWNVSRFLSSFPIVESADLADTDKWIISELDKLVKDCKAGFDEYNFFIPAIAIREFTWNVFAAQYIEMAKARAYGIEFSDAERDGAIFTLHKVLSTLLKLLAPITPFITDFLWQTLYSDKSIHTEQQAKEESNEDLTQHTQAISDFNSKVWNEKKEKGLHLPDSIKIEIPKRAGDFQERPSCDASLGIIL